MPRRLPHEIARQANVLITVDVHLSQPFLKHKLVCHPNTRVGFLRQEVSSLSQQAPESLRLMGAGG